MVYKSRSAQDAHDMGYGNESYWDYLDQHAQELHNYYIRKGNEKAAIEMLTRTLSEALKGNDGN